MYFLLTSVAAVVYRVPLTWGQNKTPWKLLHAGMLLLALILSILGLCAVFDNHNTQNIPNVYSLHSWVGISTVVLFASQVLCEIILMGQDRQDQYFTISPITALKMSYCLLYCSIIWISSIDWYWWNSNKSLMLWFVALVKLHCLTFTLHPFYSILVSTHTLKIELWVVFFAKGEADSISACGFYSQWVVGFTAFLLPCSPLEFRKLIKPTHVWMGAIILVLSTVSCISGINEKLFFALWVSIFTTSYATLYIRLKLKHCSLLPRRIIIF